MRAISGPIYAEILSGVPNQASFKRTRTLLQSLRWLPEPSAIWDRIAEVRFHLARLGYQASIVDLMIGLSASDAGVELLTRDRDLEHIARALPLTISLF